jgi:hypothetical protein
LRGTLVHERANVSGCAYASNSILECDARLSGCAQIINSTLGCSAIVYGDKVILDREIYDASEVTNCPERAASNGNCC